MATRDELEADRLALRAARVSLLTGAMVKEVSRDGRKLVYAAPTLANIDAALSDIETQLAGLDAAAGLGRPRFHALPVRFG